MLGRCGSRFHRRRGERPERGMGRRCGRAKRLTAIEQRIPLEPLVEVGDAPPKIIFANAPDPDPLRRVRDAGGASRQATVFWRSG
jgi:hypothetical protein